MSRITTFAQPQKQLKQRDYVVSGITKDSVGAVLANCTVDIFETEPGRRLVGRTVSDAAGVYSISVNGPDTGMTFEAFAYKAGAPDLAGATVNTLAGVEL